MAGDKKDGLQALKAKVARLVELKKQLDGIRTFNRTLAELDKTRESRRPKPPAS